MLEFLSSAFAGIAAPMPIANRAAIVKIALPFFIVISPYK
jgi:hypothetical protein